MRPLPLLFALGMSVAASAQPRVVVRAEARIELRAELDGDEIAVEGLLVDDRGEPMVRRPVDVAILRGDGSTLAAERVTTDSEGRFGVRAIGQATRYSLTAVFGGDSYPPRLTVERGADLTRTATRLHLAVGSGRFDLDEPTHSVRVSVSNPRGVDGLALELLDEVGRALGSATTDGSGEAIFAIAASDLGEPGAGRLVAATEGDAERASARVEAPIVRFRTATLDLAVTPAHPSPDEDLELRGRLATATGPLPGEAVGLFADGAHLATALTDADGAFRTVVPAGTLPAAPSTLVARFESDGPGVPSVESSPVVVEVRHLGLGAWAWLAIPLLLSFGIVLWLRRRAPEPDVARPTLPPPVGVEVTSSRRGPPRHDVGGLLTDSDDRPLAGDLAATSSSGERIATTIGSDGRFSLELPPGVWTLRFDAPNHAPATAEVTLPHRGNLHALRVRLETWRARALGILRDAFVRAGGSPTRWRRTTVHRLTSDPELGATASAVERSYYGPEAPDSAQVEALAQPDASSDESESKGPRTAR